MDIINIILLIIVVFIFMVLRSVLGKRTGLEKSIVIDFKEKKNQTPTDKIEEKVEKPEVIKLNQQSQEFSDEINLLEKNIKSFSIDYFLDGAKKAYEMTLIAYSEENKETLNMLLEKNIYDEFLESIEIRNNNKQKLEYSLIKVNKLDIRDIDINKNIAKIDLHIDADNEFVLTELKDEEKSINKNKAHVKEIWTFTKKLNSRNPNWKVSEISRLN